MDNEMETGSLLGFYGHHITQRVTGVTTWFLGVTNLLTKSP